jgi:hypothetical protein
MKMTNTDNTEYRFFIPNSYKHTDGSIAYRDCSGAFYNIHDGKHAGVITKDFLDKSPDWHKLTRFEWWLDYGNGRMYRDDLLYTKFTDNPTTFDNEVSRRSVLATLALWKYINEKWPA